MEDSRSFYQDDAPNADRQIDTEACECLHSITRHKPLWSIEFSSASGEISSIAIQAFPVGQVDKS